MTIRPYEPDDLPKVLPLLGDAKGIDSPNTCVRVAEEGGEIVGVTVGVLPTAGDVSYLGPVLLKDAQRWDLFHLLIASAVEYAIDHGFEIGMSQVKSVRITRHFKDTFGMDGEPSGWNPTTGAPVQWRYQGNLRDFLAQLRAVT
jgi:hypothetical protein